MNLKQTIKSNAWLIVAVIAFLVIGGLSGFLYSYVRKAAVLDHNLTVMNDTVKYIKNSNGTLTATISAFTADKAKDVIKLKTKDSVIMHLQKLMKDNEKPLDRGGAALVFNTETHLGITSPTTVSKLDSVIKTPKIGSPTVTVWPVYTSSFQYGKWAYGSTVATHDYTHVELHTHNEYEAVVGEFGGLFSTKAPQVKITTLSPLDSVKEVEAYVTSYPKAKKWGLGLSIGYGLNSTDNTVKRGFFLGVTVNRNLIVW